jgi:diguanylate cyclase (GGDEF)-like protein
MEDTSVTTRKITTEEAQACAAEAIQFIGSVQPHGFQLILDPITLQIVQYSENFLPLLNQYSSAELPQHTQVLHSSIFEWLVLVEASALKHLPHNRTVKIELSDEGIISLMSWECISYLAGKWISLEFIPTTLETYDSYSLISQMNNMIEVLRQVDGTQEMFDTITSKLQQYTQFDRVMMYRFLPDWSGEVVSEAISDNETKKYLHLRFPAEDIPKQARELYKKNKVRVFANTEAVPSPLTPARLPDGQHLDQSYSLLRNMSDMHRVYLLNMGVKATLTLSLVFENKLWGLIVFHHNTSKTPPNHVVSQLKVTCELFREIVCSYLMPAIKIHQMTRFIHVKTCIERTFNQAKMSSINDSLFAEALQTIYSVCDYDYIGIIYGQNCYCWKKDKFTLLSDQTITAISALFTDKNTTEYQSYQLHQQHTPIFGLEQMVGIYVKRSIIPAGFYVFLGRAEVEKTIRWGGMPKTVNVVMKDNQRYLEPRSSFALWRENVRGQSEFWTEQDTKILESFFVSCKDFTSVKSNEMLMATLERNSNYDALTGLANRIFFKKFIENFKKNKSLKFISLLFIDLDNFKEVNDFMGHDTGDRLLITVAKRLKACSRPKDLVVRLGGDEFVIVFLHEQMQELINLAEKVVQRIGEPIFDQEHTIVITPSVGVITNEVGEINFNEMLKRADIAMYSAKSKGKNGYHVFDSRDQDAFNRKAILTLDLRDYINSQDMELHFQPQCDFNKNVTGAETLARWNHSKFGYINPELFIQIAEENNLIKPLSLKIFKQACAQLEIWQKHRLTSHFETLSINISPSLLLDKLFQHNVNNIIKDFPTVKAKNIRLEITESIFMQDYESAIENLTALRDIGFSVSLDDFGTGYSSLNYLWKLPIDEVKIDKSFISNMSQDENLFSMVESIIELCKKLKLEVVAEGVESNVEFNILKGLGCDTCQGYFFSKPIPSDKFVETFINNEHISE